MKLMDRLDVVMDVVDDFADFCLEGVIQIVVPDYILNMSFRWQRERLERLNQNKK